MTTKIPLTNGGFAVIDDHDAPLVAGYRWRGSHEHKVTYAVAWAAGKKIRMHRLIMGAAKGQIIDHANHDGLDNRRSNLRFCTHSQNCANSRFGNAKAGFRGVVRCAKPRRKKRFQARLWVNRRVVCGPYRATAEEAAKDYDMFARRHFGAFAVLNFPAGTFIGEAHR